MKRIILSAGAIFAFALAAIALPATAMADPAICHDHILSDDAGQGCADGLYNWAICHDGILSDDVGQGCTNNIVALTGRAVVSNASSNMSYGGGLSDVPGVPPSFAACVAFRESTNGKLSSNIYGIQGPGGQGSIFEQKAAFAQMYASRGTEPWSPYDGC